MVDYEIKQFVLSRNDTIANHSKSKSNFGWEFVNSNLKDGRTEAVYKRNKELINYQALVDLEHEVSELTEVFIKLSIINSKEEDKKATVKKIKIWLGIVMTIILILFASFIYFDIKYSNSFDFMNIVLPLIIIAFLYFIYWFVGRNNKGVKDNIELIQNRVKKLNQIATGIDKKIGEK